MPNLTEKELDAIEKQLTAEDLLIKKYKSLAVLSQEPQLKTQYEQIAGQHQPHLERLLTFLN